MESPATAPKKRLLVIDDEADLVEVLKVKFQNFGFEVLTAPEGREGFRKVKEGNPDCVLLDIRIREGEDGLTFLRKLRSYRDEDFEIQSRIRRIPVIVLTSAGDSMRALFEAEGITDFVIKPYDDEDLKNRILKAVGG